METGDVKMARLHTSGFELNGLFTASSVVNPVEPYRVSGTPTFVTGRLSLGLAASLTVPAGNAIYTRFTHGAAGTTNQLPTWAAGTRYFRFYINLTNLPAADCQIVQTGAFSVRLTTTGTLQLWNADTGGAQIGSDSAALATGTWYRIEFMVTASSATTVSDLELRLDGTTVASSSGLALTSLSNVDIGWRGSTAGVGAVMDLDDFAVNDSSGSDQNSWPGSGKIVLLTPTADSAKGTGWVNDANGTTNFFDATDNKPPDGIADTVASTGLHQIRNGTSNANSSYDGTMTTYTAAGVGASDVINLVDPIVVTGAPVSTGAKAGTIGVVSNPAITNVSLAAGGTSGAFWAGLAAGNYGGGTTWKWSHGTMTYSPSVTVGTAPVARITQVTSSTRIAMVCFLGMHVDFTPVDSYVPRNPAINHAATALL